jgi:hypothetical protein
LILAPMVKKSWRLIDVSTKKTQTYELVAQQGF